MVKKGRLDLDLSMNDSMNSKEYQDKIEFWHAKQSVYEMEKEEQTEGL